MEVVPVRGETHGVQEEQARTTKAKARSSCEANRETGQSRFEGVRNFGVKLQRDIERVRE